MLEIPARRKDGIQRAYLESLSSPLEEKDFLDYLIDKETKDSEAQRVTYVSSPLKSPQINRPPVKLTLLTCQVRPNPEEKTCFDLVTRE